MDEKTKKKLIQAAGILTVPGGVTVATFMNVYDLVFQRYERPDYSLYPGEYCYERVKDKMERVLMPFYSDDVKLMGYYYPSRNPKGLVVICHGLHSGADDYLPVALYFHEKAYAVFSFDYKGTYSSEGDSTVGMCESLVDLDHALEFLKTVPELTYMPVYLFGHSWGGYAVLSILEKNKNIRAAAAVSPLADGYTIFNEKGQQYAGKLSFASKPYFDVYQKFLFRKYTEYNAIEGINSCDIPVFIAHGIEDKVIDYFTQSVPAHKAEITNPNVIYYTGKGFHGDHDDIWHSLESISYRKETESDLKVLKTEKGEALTDDEKREYFKTVDHHLYSEVNQDLMDKILKMFEEA